MKKVLPKISSKLDSIRVKARSLYRAGFNDEAAELMRISRGEVKIHAGHELFGLNATEITNAKICTNQQRLMIAANQVFGERISTSSEDNYSDSVEKLAKGNLRWQKGMPKKTLIAKHAKINNVSASSLERFMKEEGWTFSDPMLQPPFEYPDWHPDSLNFFFKKGEKDS